MFQVLEKEQIRVGVVGNISACHADAPGSIPGHGGFLFLFFFNRRRGLSFENAPAERHFARVVKGLAC